MRITVLIENTGTEDFVCEHGLSFWIEYRGKKYLLDSGSTAAFIENAEKMGVALEQTDACLLSHGHYDHSGGFHEFFTRFGERPLYAMEQVQGVYLSGSGGQLHEIGVPGELFRDFGNCFQYVKTFTEIEAGVYLLPHSGDRLDRIGARAALYRMDGGEPTPDDFAHEMSVVFQCEGGLVVFNSCSHGGIVQILEEVQEALPGQAILAFLGGLHMKGRKNGMEICTFSQGEVEEIVAYLQEKQVRKLYTGHCTGGPGLALLQNALGERTETLTTGKVIEIKD